MWEFQLSGIEDLKRLSCQLNVPVDAIEDVSILTEPVQVGGLVIPNSLAVHPMEGCDGDSQGRPGKLTLRRYERFAASGSRGSPLVLAEDGIGIHPDIINQTTGKALKFKPENESLRNSILRIEYDVSGPDLFRCGHIALRPAPADRKAFEPAWQDYREGKIYS